MLFFVHFTLHLFHFFSGLFPKMWRKTEQGDRSQFDRVTDSTDMKFDNDEIVNLCSGSMTLFLIKIKSDNLNQN